MHAAKTFKKCFENSNWNVFNNAHASESERAVVRYFSVWRWTALLVSEGRMMSVLLTASTHIYPHTCLSSAKWISQGHLANWLTCVLYITLKYIWITIKKTFAIAKETYYLWLFWLISSTFELIGSPKFKASHHLKRQTSHKVSVGTMCFHLPRRRPLAVLLLRFLHAASSYAFTIQFPSLNEPFRLAAWVLTLNS